MPPVERFSTGYRAVRAGAAVLTAARIWLKKGLKSTGALDSEFWKVPSQNKSGKSYEIRSMFSHSTLKEAEILFMRRMQAEEFEKELKYLQNPDRKPDKHSILFKLSPMLDSNSIIQMEGRTQKSCLSEDAMHPIILPARHHWTDLVIMAEHVRNGHQGHGTVFNNLRERFHLIGGLTTVRRVCGQCQTCKLRKAKPVNPRMGQLPSYRLATGRAPFTFTEVDFFGPIEVTVGRHHEKRWGAVFTCMVTRAIHLEIAYGLSTSEMMMVLSRFIDTRGRPKHIFSDNGTNFVGCNRELKEQWETIDWTSVAAAEKFHQIKWHFLPAFAPHMRGAWERMVQSVKKILRVSLNQRYPYDQTLLTIIKGAENIINSRPLTYVSGDANEPEALTPNHFLKGAASVGPSIPGTYEVGEETLRKNWRQAQAVLDGLWARWTKEYLPELNKRTKWLSETEPLEVGDIVLLVDQLQPRNTWVKAVITKTFPGDDGQVRVVDAMTRSFGTKKTSTYRRNVDRVVKLGLRMNV